MHVQAWSPLGPTVCGDLHESVSMTEKPSAQPTRLCGHGRIYDAKRTSLLTSHEA